jgi:hypothetical protein
VVENKDEIIKNFKEIEANGEHLYQLMENMLDEADKACTINGDCR